MTARRAASVGRAASLVALGSLCVHQLRYLLAYRADAGHELASQGHGYLTQAVPILLSVVLAIVAAGVLRAALGSEVTRSRAGFATRACVFAAAILSTFAVQEMAEGLIFSGHLSGLAAVFGDGAWLGLPLALTLGLLCAALDRGLEDLEVSISAAAQRVRLPRPPLSISPFAAVPLAGRPISPLAFGIARRPPPLTG